MEQENLSLSEQERENESEIVVNSSSAEQEIQSVTNISEGEPEKATEKVESVEDSSMSAVSEPVETTAVETAQVPTDAPEVASETTTTQETESKLVVEVEPSAERKRRIRRSRLLQSFAEVKKAFENDQPIEVYVYSRVRGGLRVYYKEAPLFLPASHFHLKKSPTDEELLEVVGKKLMVKVHEVQEYDEGSMAVIVSRKKLLEDEFWNSLTVGQVVEGKISSIASFGVFIDLEGVEGLIHVSNLAPYRIDNLKEHFKLGDVLKAVIIEVNKEQKRIGLSRKEFVDASWDVSPEKYAVGTKHTGIVRRILEFGAFVELEPGVEGLLRTSEISWTKRIRRPSEIIKVGEQVEVVVTAFNFERRTISLSMKRLTENPWFSLHEKYPIHSVFEGVIKQVVPQGCVISINDEIDGFLPRSKMKKLLRGNKIPYRSGDKLKVEVADIVPDDESLILGVVQEEVEQHNSPTKKAQQQPKNFESKPLNTGISIMDMISDDEKQNLIKSLKK